MSECKVTVDAGVCRFKTVIEAVGDDMMNVTFRIKSECPAVRKMAADLQEPISVFEIIEMPFGNNPIYRVAGKTIQHSACPVPSATIKAAEVAGDLGLRRDVTFKVE